MLIFLVFCVALLYVFTFCVPCCDGRYDFRIKTMFGSCLAPVVCLIYVMCSCLGIVVSTSLCCVLLCLSTSVPMLPISLVCLFGIL